MNVQHNVAGEWTTGLCDCCEDPGSCLKTCCCPCVTFGQNAAMVDRNNTSCFGSGLVFCMLSYFGISCLYSYQYRNKLRELYNLPEKPCGDCMLHWCCTQCAICQEYRELNNRGLNPSIGREAASAMAPPKIATGMPRA